MASENLNWLEDEWEGLPDPPAAPDPTWSLRRLAGAILVRAVQDSHYRDPHLRRDALLFLLPLETAHREHLAQTIQISGVNQRWLRRCVEKCRDAKVNKTRRKRSRDRAAGEAMGQQSEKLMPCPLESRQDAR